MATRKQSWRSKSTPNVYTSTASSNRASTIYLSHLNDLQVQGSNYSHTSPISDTNSLTSQQEVNDFVSCVNLLQIDAFIHATCLLMVIYFVLEFYSMNNRVDDSYFKVTKTTQNVIEMIICLLLVVQGLLISLQKRQFTRFHFIKLIKEHLYSYQIMCKLVIKNVFQNIMQIRAKTNEKIYYDNTKPYLVSPDSKKEKRGLKKYYTVIRDVVVSKPSSNASNAPNEQENEQASELVATESKLVVANKQHTQHQKTVKKDANPKPNAQLYINNLQDTQFLANSSNNTICIENKKKKEITSETNHIKNSNANIKQSISNDNANCYENEKCNEINIKANESHSNGNEKTNASELNNNESINESSSKNSNKNSIENNEYGIAKENKSDLNMSRNDNAKQKESESNNSVNNIDNASNAFQNDNKYDSNDNENIEDGKSLKSNAIANSNVKENELESNDNENNNENRNTSKLNTIANDNEKENEFEASNNKNNNKNAKSLKSKENANNDENEFESTDNKISRENSCSKVQNVKKFDSNCNQNSSENAKTSKLTAHVINIRNDWNLNENENEDELQTLGNVNSNESCLNANEKEFDILNSSFPNRNIVQKNKLIYSLANINSVDNLTRKFNILMKLKQVNFAALSIDDIKKCIKVLVNGCNQRIQVLNNDAKNTQKLELAESHSQAIGIQYLTVRVVYYLYLRSLACKQKNTKRAAQEYENYVKPTLNAVDVDQLTANCILIDVTSESEHTKCSFEFSSPRFGPKNTNFQQTKMKLQKTNSTLIQSISDQKVTHTNKKLVSQIDDKENHSHVDVKINVNENSIQQKNEQENSNKSGYEKFLNESIKKGSESDKEINKDDDKRDYSESEVSAYEESRKRRKRKKKRKKKQQRKKKKRKERERSDTEHSEDELWRILADETKKSKNCNKYKTEKSKILLNTKETCKTNNSFKISCREEKKTTKHQKHRLTTSPGSTDTSSNYNVSESNNFLSSSYSLDSSIPLENTYNSNTDWSYNNSNDSSKRDFRVNHAHTRSHHCANSRVQKQCRQNYNRPRQCYRGNRTNIEYYSHQNRQSSDKRHISYVNCMNSQARSNNYHSNLMTDSDIKRSHRFIKNNHNYKQQHAKNNKMNIISSKKALLKKKKRWRKRTDDKKQLKENETNQMNTAQTQLNTVKKKRKEEKCRRQRMKQRNVKMIDISPAAQSYMLQRKENTSLQSDLKIIENAENYCEIEERHSEMIDSLKSKPISIHLTNDIAVDSQRPTASNAVKLPNVEEKSSSMSLRSTQFENENQQTALHGSSRFEQVDTCQLEKSFTSIETSHTVSSIPHTSSTPPITCNFFRTTTITATVLSQQQQEEQCLDDTSSVSKSTIRLDTIGDANNTATAVLVQSELDLNIPVSNETDNEMILDKNLFNLDTKNQIVRKKDPNLKKIAMHEELHSQCSQSKPTGTTKTPAIDGSDFYLTENEAIDNEKEETLNASQNKRNNISISKNVSRKDSLQSDFYSKTAKIEETNGKSDETDELDMNKKIELKMLALPQTLTTAMELIRTPKLNEKLSTNDPRLVQKQRELSINHKKGIRKHENLVAKKENELMNNNMASKEVNFKIKKLKYSKKRQKRYYQTLNNLKEQKQSYSRLVSNTMDKIALLEKQNQKFSNLNEKWNNANESKSHEKQSKLCNIQNEYQIIELLNEIKSYEMKMTALKEKINEKMKEMTRFDTNSNDCDTSKPNMPKMQEKSSLLANGFELEYSNALHTKANAQKLLNHNEWQKTRSKSVESQTKQMLIKQKRLQLNVKIKMAKLQELRRKQVKMESLVLNRNETKSDVKNKKKEKVEAKINKKTHRQKCEYQKIKFRKKLNQNRKHRKNTLHKNKQTQYCMYYTHKKHHKLGQLQSQSMTKTHDNNVTQESTCWQLFTLLYSCILGLWNCINIKLVYIFGCELFCFVLFAFWFLNANFWCKFNYVINLCAINFIIAYLSRLILFVIDNFDLNEISNILKRMQHNFCYVFNVFAILFSLCHASCKFIHWLWIQFMYFMRKFAGLVKYLLIEFSKLGLEPYCFVLHILLIFPLSHSTRAMVDSEKITLKPYIQTLHYWFASDNTCINTKHNELFAITDYTETGNLIEANTFMAEIDINTAAINTFFANVCTSVPEVLFTDQTSGNLVNTSNYAASICEIERTNKLIDVRQNCTIYLKYHELERISRQKHSSNEQNRLNISLHTVKNIENGLFALDMKRMIDKKIQTSEREVQRVRSHPASEFYWLTKDTISVHVICSYQYLFEHLGSPEIITVTDQTNFELKHLAGKYNLLADYLSRDGSALNDIFSPKFSDPSIDCLIGREPTLMDKPLKSKTKTVTKAQVKNSISTMLKCPNRLAHFAKLQTPTNQLFNLSAHLESDSGVPDNFKHLVLECLRQHGKVQRNWTEQNYKKYLHLHNNARKHENALRDDEWKVEITNYPAPGPFSPKPNIVPRRSILVNKYLNKRAKYDLKMQDIWSKSHLKTLKQNLHTALTHTLAKISVPSRTPDPTFSSHQLNYLVEDRIDCVQDYKNQQKGYSLDPKKPVDDASYANLVGHTNKAKYLHCMHNLKHTYDTPDQRDLKPTDYWPDALANPYLLLNNQVDANALAQKTEKKVKLVEPDESTYRTNYVTDERFRYSSKRPKKPVSKFWELPQVSDPNYGKPRAQKVNTNQKKHKNTYKKVDSELGKTGNNLKLADYEKFARDMDDVTVPSHDELQQHDWDRSSSPQSKYEISFPYAVSAKLIHSFCNRVFLPEEYLNKLTPKNVLYFQQRDEMCIRIRKILQYGDTNSMTTLKVLAPTLFHNVKKGELYIDKKRGLIMQKPTKSHINTRTYVPEALIHTVLDFERTINNIGHPGVAQMRTIRRNRWFWYKMSIAIQNYVNQCPICQEGKGSMKHKVGKLSPIKHTAAPGQPVHGMPFQLLTDRGTGFISRANKIVCKMLGIDKIFTSAYHPQTHAKAERVVQELKKSLRMLYLTLDGQFTSKIDDISSQRMKFKNEIKLILPSIQFSINQKIHAMIAISPYMILYGRNLRDIVDLKLAQEFCTDYLPDLFQKKTHYDFVRQTQAAIDLARRDRDDNYEKYILISSENFDVGKYDVKYTPGDMVAYFCGDQSGRNIKLRKLFTGPWEVAQHTRDNIVQIRNPDTGDNLCVHAKMLKKYYLEAFRPRNEVIREEREERQKRLIDELNRVNELQARKNKKEFKYRQQRHRIKEAKQQDDQIT